MQACDLFSLFVGSVGLQMLHNIMKQNRGNFNRTPIIRKLLKVSDFSRLFY